jgi:hypothetical protein
MRPPNSPDDLARAISAHRADIGELLTRIKQQRMDLEKFAEKAERIRVPLRSKFVYRENSMLLRPGFMEVKAPESVHLVDAMLANQEALIGRRYGEHFIEGNDVEFGISDDRAEKQRPLTRMGPSGFSSRSESTPPIRAEQQISNTSVEMGRIWALNKSTEKTTETNGILPIIEAIQCADVESRVEQRDDTNVAIPSQTTNSVSFVQPFSAIRPRSPGLNIVTKSNT